MLFFSSSCKLKKKKNWLHLQEFCTCRLFVYCWVCFWYWEQTVCISGKVYFFSVESDRCSWKLSQDSSSNFSFCENFPRNGSVTTVILLFDSAQSNHCAWLERSSSGFRYWFNGQQQKKYVFPENLILLTKHGFPSALSCARLFSPSPINVVIVFQSKPTSVVKSNIF